MERNVEPRFGKPHGNRHADSPRRAGHESSPFLDSTRFQHASMPRK
jgi:hypothetical protein